MRILLTGGCGFIGSAVVRHLIRATGHEVVNVDSMTYAASADALEEAGADLRHLHLRADVTDADAMRAIFAQHRPDPDRRRGVGRAHQAGARASSNTPARSWPDSAA